MRWVNVGAYVNDVRPKTKKALKEAVETAPATVKFDYTSFYPEEGMPRELNTTNIPEEVTLLVCGPDPYTKRRWYASACPTSDGVKVT